MKALSRKGRRARPPAKVKRAQSLQALQQLEVAKPTAEYEIVQQLQHVLARIDHLPLPIGQLGCEFLDCLKLTERISEKVFTKARELLKREPHAIPGWSCNETPQRVLSRDTTAIFRTISKSLDIDALDFLQACSVSLSSLRKLIAEWNPGIDVDEIEFTLNHTLENLIHHELVARLSRSKDRQLRLTL